MSFSSLENVVRLKEVMICMYLFTQTWSLNVAFYVNSLQEFQLPAVSESMAFQFFGNIMRLLKLGK